MAITQLTGTLTGNQSLVTAEGPTHVQQVTLIIALRYVIYLPLLELDHRRMNKQSR